MTRQDSAFYTNSSGTEVVWDKDPNKRFYAVRNGEMRIIAKKDAEDSHSDIIRYTDALESFGITDDKTLAEWTDKGEEVFSWVNNSWFEVYDKNDPDFFSDPIHELDEAIEYANFLSEKFGADKEVEYEL
jgi:hypothetical protein